MENAVWFFSITVRQEKPTVPVPPRRAKWLLLGSLRFATTEQAGPGVAVRFQSVSSTALALAACIHLTNPSAAAAAEALPALQPAAAAIHPGQAIYESTCAACHDNPEATRSPSLETLQAMRYQTLELRADSGQDAGAGCGVCPPSRERAAHRLSGRPRGTPMTVDRQRPCARPTDAASTSTRAADRRGLWLRHAESPSAPARADEAHDGRLPQSRTRLGLRFSEGDDDALAACGRRVRPSFCLSPTRSACSPSTSRASRASNGCTSTKRRCERAAAYGELPGSKRKVLVFGDLAANIHMVDALTGARIWKHARRPLSATRSRRARPCFTETACMRRSPSTRFRSAPMRSTSAANRTAR